ncbi:MAG: hypothetical protein DYH13_10910 [Alphaproteobacteria bacterium PRO2]|nr:hypothetical protein [Alphaproteobacteria bacterium PRO2]
MDDNFLAHVREKIKKTRGLSVAGLALQMHKSESQTYRILNGDAPYQPHYTRIIRDYVGIGSRMDRTGNEMAVVDLIDLRAANSFERDEDVIARITLLEEMLPLNVDSKLVKLVKVVGDHCAPEYKPGEYVFIDTSQTVPEPPGIFLLWTGVGYKFQLCEHIFASNPPRVRLSSIAAGYSPVEISLAGADIRGRAIGKISIPKN